MSLIVYENTYMTIEEASSIVGDMYFEGDKETEVWEGLGDIDKAKLLKIATRRIDRLPFLGKRYIESGSKLAFPRIIHNRVIECPYDVKCAIVAYGIYLKMNKDNQARELRSQSIKSYSIEGASITFDDKATDWNGVDLRIIQDYLVSWIY